MESYSDRTLCRTIITGTFKKVYEVSEQEGRFPCNNGTEPWYIRLPRSFFNKGPVIALRIKVGTGGDEMQVGEIINEIATMYKFKDISPELIGTVIYYKNDTINVINGYETQNLDSVKFVFLIVQKCDDMTFCLKDPTVLADNILSLTRSLIRNNHLFTDFGLKNLCCFRGQLKMIDLDPKFYSELSDTDNKETYLYMMMLILLMIFRPNTPLERLLANRLVHNGFGFIIMSKPDMLHHFIRSILMETYNDSSDVQPYVPGEYNAFRMLCHYAYIDGNTSLSEEYMNLRRQKVIDIPFIIRVANQVTDRLLVYATYTEGGRKRSKRRTRRSNKKIKVNHTKHESL
jgi:hypothetical protein